MKQAIGVIETSGMPGALAVADVMGKAATVTVVGLENTHAGRISVIIRGDTGAVQAAISSTVKALAHHSGVTLLGHHIVPCPDGSVQTSGLAPSQPHLASTDSVEWLDD